MPELRDPKTSQIWTPLNVGQKSGPNTPQDRAFDPLAQTASINGVVIPKVPVTALGSVPITTGPTVPIVNLEIATLRAVPGMRWQVTMYLNNNSGEAVTPIIACNFTQSRQAGRGDPADVADRWATLACRLRRTWAEGDPLRRSREVSC